MANEKPVVQTATPAKAEVKSTEITEVELIRKIKKDIKAIKVLKDINNSECNKSIVIIKKEIETLKSAILKMTKDKLDALEIEDEE